MEHFTAQGQNLRKETNIIAHCHEIMTILGYGTSAHMGRREPLHLPVNMNGENTTILNWDKKEPGNWRLKSTNYFSKTSISGTRALKALDRWEIAFFWEGVISALVNGGICASACAG